MAESSKLPLKGSWGVAPLFHEGQTQAGSVQAVGLSRPPQGTAEPQRLATPRARGTRGPGLVFPALSLPPGTSPHRRHAVAVGHSFLGFWF